MSFMKEKKIPREFELATIEAKVERGIMIVWQKLREGKITEIEAEKRVARYEAVKELAQKRFTPDERTVAGVLGLLRS